MFSSNFTSARYIVNIIKFLAALSTLSFISHVPILYSSTFLVLFKVRTHTKRPLRIFNCNLKIWTRERTPKRYIRILHVLLILTTFSLSLMLLLMSSLRIILRIVDSSSHGMLFEVVYLSTVYLSEIR